MTNFELERWGNPINDRSLRNSFNNNAEIMEQMYLDLLKKHEYTVKMLENLVLNAGGDSPNEVVASRVTLDGTAHDSLSSRLAAEIGLLKQEIKDNEAQLASFATVTVELRYQLDQIYNASQGSIVVYVDAKNGSDETGVGTVGKPYRTITKAVSTLPSITPSDIYIYCQPGVYDEDVYLSQINAPVIEIQPTNLNSVDPTARDTGFFVRSITAHNIPNYLGIRGVTQYNIANSGAKYANDTDSNPCTFYFDRVGYHALDRCRFVLNGKSFSNHAIYSGSSQGNTYNCHFENQFICYRTNYVSVTNFGGSNTGKNNDQALVAGRSIIFNQKHQIQATKADGAYAAGQIWVG